MGKVFTWSELLQCKVPDFSNFEIVLKNLREKLAVEPSILAAVVCGSVIRNDHTRRSDIDCVVVYEGDRSRRAFNTLQELSVLASNHFVPLSFIGNDSRIIGTRMHHLGPAFMEHVAFSMRDGGLIKGKLLEMVAPSVQRNISVEEYLRYKLHSLQEQWAHYKAFSEEEQARFLQKILEAPIHVARRMLSWQEPLSGDSKRYIFELYTERMPGRLPVRLDQVIGLDRQYTQELEKQLQSLNEHDYEVVLGYLQTEVPTVLEFVTQNLLHLVDAAP